MGRKKMGAVSSMRLRQTGSIGTPGGVRLAGIFQEITRQGRALRESQDRLMKLEAAIEADNERWLKTSEAAALLGVGRQRLDEIAQAACEARPDLVVQVGTGEARRSYRWRADGLAEAFAAGTATPPESPAKLKRRQRKKDASEGPPRSRWTP